MLNKENVHERQSPSSLQRLDLKNEVENIKSFEMNIILMPLRNKHYIADINVRVLGKSGKGQSFMPKMQ